MFNTKNNYTDEIVIRDDKGQLKIWRNSQWQDLKEAEKITPEKPKITAIIDTGMEGPFLPPLKPEISPLKQILQEPKKYGINKITNKVFEVLQLNLTSEFKRRLKNILYSYCRHTRGLLDCLDVLEKEATDGGLGFSIVEAERIMAIVKNILEKIDQEGGIILDEGTTLEEIRPLKAPQTPNKSVEEKPEHIFKQTKDQEEIQAMRTIINQPVTIKPRILPKSDFPKITRPEENSDKKITEVKKKRLILGPIEELASYTLEDFRRLSTDPKTRVKKIIEKIELLAEESITKKAAGVRAWHQSQVYQEYLDIGEESISKNINVENIIKEKQQQNQETMTIGEFEALLDLSQKLRF